MVAAQSKPSTALFQRSLDFSITGENYVDIFRNPLRGTGLPVKRMLDSRLRRARNKNNSYSYNSLSMVLC